MTDASEEPELVTRARVRAGELGSAISSAPSGKVDGLEHSVAALAPGGVLVVDDMDPALHVDDGLVDAIADVRKHLMHDASVLAVDITWSTGVILATKRAA